eukprot:GHVQ01036889.1.p1 GENE.GHVQ01036889.1~~GHVQ01036889.1.p1  ORF type:complete len:619 (-),score=168.11 GHVQ01036889.1:1405-3261(-)
MSLFDSLDPNTSSSSSEDVYTAASAGISVDSGETVDGVVLSSSLENLQSSSHVGDHGTVHQAETGLGRKGLFDGDDVGGHTGVVDVLNSSGRESTTSALGVSDSLSSTSASFAVSLNTGGGGLSSAIDNANASSDSAADDAAAAGLAAVAGLAAAAGLDSSAAGGGSGAEGTDVNDGGVERLKQDGDTSDGNAQGGGTGLQKEGEGGDVVIGGGSADADEGDKGLKFFVGGIRPDVWDEDLRKHFAVFGTVQEVQVMKDHATGRNRGFGFVTMAAETDSSAIFRKDHHIKEKKVEVRQMQPDGTSNLKRKLFMGGINPAVNEDALDTYFKQFGDIEKVTIMRDLEGKSRGFGFVVYVDENTVKEVLKKSIHQVDKETKIEVRAAEARHRPQFVVQRMHLPPRPPARPPFPPYGPYSVPPLYMNQFYPRPPHNPYAPPYVPAPPSHHNPYYPAPPSPSPYAAAPPQPPYAQMYPSSPPPSAASPMPPSGCPYSPYPPSAYPSAAPQHPAVGSPPMPRPAVGGGVPGAIPGQVVGQSTVGSAGAKGGAVAAAGVQSAYGAQQVQAAYAAYAAAYGPQAAAAAYAAQGYDVYGPQRGTTAGEAVPRATSGRGRGAYRTAPY